MRTMTFAMCIRHYIEIYFVYVCVCIWICLCIEPSVYYYCLQAIVAGFALTAFAVRLNHVKTVAKAYLAKNNLLCMKEFLLPFIYLASQTFSFSALSIGKLVATFWKRQTNSWLVQVQMKISITESNTLSI